MLNRLRRRSGTPGVPAGPSMALSLADYPGIDALLDAGDIPAAVALVADRKPGASRDEVSRIELQLRNEAFRRAAAHSAEDVGWPPSTDEQVTATDGIPDIPASELDRDRLVAGVRNQGVLIARGLFSDDTCATLRSMIDETMAAFEQDRQRIDPAWNTPLADVSGEVQGATHFRAFNHGAAGLSAADSPRSASFILAAFQEAGLPDLVESYLGERPALSLEKWTLRRVPPDTGSSWHQDGAFLGAEKHALNLWIALSDCGERASGLDIVARRLDHIVPTGTPGAFFDWDVAPDVVERERGDQPVVSPVFRAGDAVFFDQYLLHKTGTNPGFTENRYALESWFFTPSSFPSHYSGLLV